MCVEGYQPYRRPHLSMHQMGTCRMGASPDSSVADAHGQCWDVAGLYIADASCFPTSSGQPFSPLQPKFCCKCSFGLTSVLTIAHLPTSPCGYACESPLSSSTQQLHIHGWKHKVKLESACWLVQSSGACRNSNVCQQNLVTVLMVSTQQTLSTHT